MKLCWLEDSNARPSFSGLTMKLKKMENQHKVHVRLEQETSWTSPSVVLLQICLPSLASLELQTYNCNLE